jgi:predicted ATPase
MNVNQIRRIAVTGGPGAGKTTVWRALAEAHDARVVAVAEVATPLLQHVFPSVQCEADRCAVQRAIFEVQKTLESAHESRLRPGQVLLCDRGTPDGGGYWPAGHAAFFAAMGTDWSTELARYDAVLFLQTAAAGGLSISGGGNVTRTEDAQTAIAIDGRLQAIWSKHPRFHHVAVEQDFAVKVARGSAVLQHLLDAQ